MDMTPGPVATAMELALQKVAEMATLAAAAVAAAAATPSQLQLPANTQQPARASSRMKPRLDYKSINRGSWVGTGKQK
jgi:hypothetical protein